MATNDSLNLIQCTFCLKIVKNYESKSQSGKVIMTNFLNSRRPQNLLNGEVVLL